MSDHNLRPAHAVIAGSFADYRLVKSRSVLQVIVEIPIEMQGAAFAALGYPLPGTEIPVAVARLNSPAGNSQPQPDRKGFGNTDGNGPQPQRPPAGERRPWESLSPQQQAGILCADKGFQKYVNEKTKAGWIADEQSAAVWLREQLGILSRRDLEGRPDLAAKLNAIRDHFLEWAGRVPVAVR